MMDVLINENNEVNEILEVLCDELIHVKSKMVEMEQQHCLNIYYAKFIKLYLAKNIDLIDNLSVKKDVEELVRFIEQNIDTLEIEWKLFIHEYKEQENVMAKTLKSDNRDLDYENKVKNAKMLFVKNFKESLKKYQITLENFQSKNKILNDQIANDFRQEDIKELLEEIAKM